MKRALVIGAGGLRGAYDAGAAAELCRVLGEDYFDAIYGCSAGAYVATYFLTGQPDSLEHMWRNDLDGKKFINFSNPFRGRNSLDLEYLTYLMGRKETLLNKKNIQSGSARLVYALTDQTTGDPVWLEPTPKNVFALLAASSAIPLLHPPVFLEEASYIDGSLSDPLPFEKALHDGYKEVMVIYNKPKGFDLGLSHKLFSNIAATLIPHFLTHLTKNLMIAFS